MKLFVYVLNRTEKLQEVLAAYVEVDIPGATIIDSVGMGRVLTSEIPVFAGFRDIIQSREGNRMILSVVEDDARIDELLLLIEEICGPFDEPGAGISFTVPIENVRGLRPAD